MKEDRYEFDLDEWNIEMSPYLVPYNKAILTRKKPKVKVEWSNCSRFGDGMGENGIDFTHYGYERYHIVQFRVAGRVEGGAYEYNYSLGNWVFYISPTRSKTMLREYEHNTLVFIGSDARDKWSAPVLLPESIYSNLDDICKVLEQKANQ